MKILTTSDHLQWLPLPLEDNEEESGAGGDGQQQEEDSGAELGDFIMELAGSGGSSDDGQQGEGQGAGSTEQLGQFQQQMTMLAEQVAQSSKQNSDILAALSKQNTGGSSDGSAGIDALVKALNGKQEPEEEAFTMSEEDLLAGLGDDERAAAEKFPAIKKMMLQIVKNGAGMAAKRSRVPDGLVTKEDLDKRFASMTGKFEQTGIYSAASAIEPSVATHKDTEGFKSFLTGTDEATGLPRSALLAAGEATKSAAAIANVFAAYNKTLGKTGTPSYGGGGGKKQSAGVVKGKITMDEALARADAMYEAGSLTDEQYEKVYQGLRESL